MSKENEKRERTKESKEKESVLFAQASARAREAELLPPVIDVHKPPTLKLLLAFAHIRSFRPGVPYTRSISALASVNKCPGFTQ